MSLNHFLTRLIWTCMLPLVLLATYLAVDKVRTIQSEDDAEAANLARNFGTAIDNHLIARAGALQILAMSPHAGSPSDWAELYQEAQGYRKIFGSHVIFADLNGRMLFNTRAPFGATLPLLPKPRNHEAARTAMETGKPAVGDVFRGPIANEPLVAVAVPVLHEGKAIFLVLTIVETRQFQNWIEQVALPAGWSLALLDGNDEVIASRGPPGMKSVAEIETGARFAVKSEVSPWSVVLRIPRAIYRASMIAGVVEALTAILFAALLGLLGGMLASRRLGRSVASLTEIPAPGGPVSRITEIAVARRNLEDAAEKRVTAEARQHESEQRFRAMIENASDLIVLIDAGGAITYASPSLTGLGGYSATEALGRSILEFTHPDDLPAAATALSAVLRNPDEPHRAEIRWLHKDGGSVFLESVAKNELENPSLQAIVINARDVTSRRRAEREIRESEGRFRAVLEQSIAAIYVIQDSRVVYVNPRMREIFGYTPTEPFEPNPLAYIKEADRPMVIEKMRQRLAGEGDDASYSITAFRKDRSEITLCIHATRASYQGEPAIIALAQDITDKARADDEVRRYVATLERAMQNTIEVISIISEMRDPYTHGHEHRVSKIATAIATEMGLPAEQIEGIRIAGYLHDVGKIAVPAEILAKPTRLSTAEFALVKQHAQLSYEILKSIEFQWPVAQAAWQHHERLDGSGYPRGLKGEEIILEARILAVADTVEAMASHRPYRAGLGIDKALAEIERGRGILFDSQVVDTCLRLFREKDFRTPE